MIVIGFGAMFNNSELLETMPNLTANFCQLVFSVV